MKLFCHQAEETEETKKIKDLASFVNNMLTHTENNEK